MNIRSPVYQMLRVADWTACRWRTICGLSCWLVLLGTPLRAIAEGEPTNVAGHWEGIVQDTSLPFGIKVNLSVDGIVWTGRIQVPLWGNDEWDLEKVRVAGRHVHFEVDGRSFDGAMKGETVEGTFARGTQRRTFWLKRGRIEQSDHPRRPQIPRGPFPYWIEEVRISSGQQMIAGLLTVPDGNGPYPAALLLCGSAAFDRDYGEYNHFTFLVLADSLARAGIASLRIDSRGVGESSGSFSECTIDDLASDARECVNYLSKRDEIRHDQIGIVGHSLGTMVAMRAAKATPRISFCVLLAPYAGRGDLQSVVQLVDIEKARGLPRLRILIDVIDRLVFICGSEAGIPREVCELVDEIIRYPMVPTAKLLGMRVYTPSEEYEDKYFKPITQSIFLSDPCDDFRQARIPILAIGGTLDLKVRQKQTLHALNRQAASAGNKDITILLETGLNHCLQTAVTGLPEEERSLDETLAPQVMSAVNGWILGKCKKTEIQRGRKPGRKPIS